MSAPLYEGLAANLRQAIAAGEVPPGHRLPSEAELQQQHGVSRQTVRRALDLLEREGILRSGARRGWFVNETRPLVWRASRPERNLQTDVVPADSWSRDIRDQGRAPSERIAVSIEAAMPRIAERLRLDTGANLVVRKRHRYVDGELFTTADTYYPYDIVAGTAIAQPSDVLPGVWAVMEELGYGWDDTRRSDETRARPAAADEAALFGVHPGTPVIEHVRTRRTADGRPVAVMVTVAPGDRLTVVYEPLEGS